MKPQIQRSALAPISPALAEKIEAARAKQKAIRKKYVESAFHHVWIAPGKPAVISIVEF